MSGKLKKLHEIEIKIKYLYTKTRKEKYAKKMTISSLDLA